MVLTELLWGWNYQTGTKYKLCFHPYIKASLNRNNDLFLRRNKILNKIRHLLGIPLLN